MPRGIYDRKKAGLAKRAKKVQRRARSVSEVLDEVSTKSKEIEAFETNDGTLTKYHKVPEDFNPTNPSHYFSPYPVENVYVDADGNIFLQVVDIARAWGFLMSAFKFNMLKYLLRAGRKGTEEINDLGKLIWYAKEELSEANKASEGK